jgi:hypothetical protein
MKQITTVLQFFLFVLPMLLFLKCSNSEPEPRIALSGVVLDSIYNKKAAFIDSFFSKIDWIGGSKELSRPLKILDSGDVSDKVLFSKTDTAAPFCTDSVKLTVKNFIFINNKTNLTYFPDPDSIISKLKAAYFISKFEYSVSGISPIDHIPHFWQYHNDPGYNKGFDDSISLKKKNDLIKNKINETSAIDSIRYIILVSDVLMKKPQMLSEKYFQPGELVTTLKLYEISSKKLLCQKVLYINNSDEIRHHFVGVDGKLLNTVLNKLLIEDFIYHKNRRIIDLFKIGF